MNDTQSKLLLRLIELSKFDASLAALLAEKKKIEDTLADRLLARKSLQTKYEDIASQCTLEKSKHQKEEKRLKEENEKLVDRRKALNSFSDYKVQQSAQKEIEQSAKQIAAQEEKLLSGLDELDALEKQVSELKEKLETESKELEQMESDTKAQLASIEERSLEKQASRDELASGIKGPDLTVYERIRKRHIDPVVLIENGICSGCNMQVGAQMMVQVSRANALIKCRGCGRILYLPEHQDDAGASGSADSAAGAQ